MLRTRNVMPYRVGPDPTRTSLRLIVHVRVGSRMEFPRYGGVRSSKWNDHFAGVLVESCFVADNS